MHHCIHPTNLCCALPPPCSPPRSCCSKDAEGQETRVTIDLGGEGFTATGLMVTERNFLDIYRYQSWGGQDQLPLFTQGQTFTPAAVELKQVGKAAALQPPLDAC